MTVGVWPIQRHEGSFSRCSSLRWGRHRCSDVIGCVRAGLVSFHTAVHDSETSYGLFVSPLSGIAYFARCVLRPLQVFPDAYDMGMGARASANPDLVRNYG